MVTVKQVPDFLRAAVVQTLPGLFVSRVQRSPEKIAYQQFDAVAGHWRNYTWQAMHELVSRWQQALATQELAAGDRVAVMLNNCIEWVCFDQAAQSLGLVTVSLYTTDTAENIAYILADAGARLLLVGEISHWQLLARQQSKLPTLQHVWCLRRSEWPEKAEQQRVQFLDEVLPHTPAEYINRVTDTHAVATLIYTSGTTGRPKGVMLSHHNILANAEAVQKQVPAYPDDVFLSFLPLAHGFERTVEYILPMMAGSQVTYARSINQLKEDLLIVRPTVFLSAPRLYEKIYVAIQEQLIANKLKRKLFAWTTNLGWKRFLAEQQRGPALNLLQSVLWFFLYSLVSKKVLAKMGGRLRIAVTGAAPMSEKITRFFLGIGFPLYEGYGLTEAGPVVSSNRQDKNIPGSVGVALPGVEVMTAENGELLVRSPGVMQGYWQRQEDTHMAIDAEEWLHTGDLAEIRQDIIHIRGRLKEIIVTSTGEKIAPTDMETAIILDPLFEQAMVVGEGKPYIAALLVLNRQAWEIFAEELGLEPGEEQSLSSDQAVKAVLNKLAVVLAAIPGYVQVRAVYLTCAPWTIENGLLTPTMKIKRNVLEQEFAAQIRELYRGHVMVE